MAATVNAGQLLVGNLLPAARLRTLACPGRGIYDYQTKARTDATCSNAIDREDTAEADLALHTRERWMEAVSRISAQLDLYYGAEVANQWHRYTASVTRYFRVGTEDGCDANRTKVASLGAAYDSSIPRVWRHSFSIPRSFGGRTLVSSNGHQAKCWDLPSALYRDYVFVGQQIISDETPLLRTIEARSATGYSHGVTGVLNDALPFIIIFGATAIAIGIVLAFVGPSTGRSTLDRDKPDANLRR